MGSVFWATVVIIGNGFAGVYSDHGTKPMPYLACLRAIPGLQQRAQRDPQVLARPGVMAMVGTCSRKTPQEQIDEISSLVPDQI